MYKLISIDMDGTLLNSEGKISQKNKEALKYAIDKGVKVVFTTGRGIKGIEEFIKEAGLSDKDEYVITNNGVSLYKTNTLKCISSHELSHKDIKELCEVAFDIGAELLIYDYESEGSIFLKYSKYVEFEKDHIGMPVRIVKDYYENLSEKDKAFKVIFVGDKDKEDVIEHKIPQSIRDKYTVVRSLPNIIEIFDKSSNKGNAVKELAGIFNFKREEVICIGDQQNDMEMIKYAGLGIAMGNGIDDLKEIADYVTDTNDNNGVAKAIRKFI